MHTRHKHGTNNKRPEASMAQYNVIFNISVRLVSELLDIIHPVCLNEWINTYKESHLVKSWILMYIIFYVIIGTTELQALTKKYKYVVK